MIIRKRTNRSGVVRFQLDLGKIDGKRIQISFATLDEAEAMLAAKKQERKIHGQASLKFTDADRYLFMVAQERLRAHKATIADAVTFFIAHHRPREVLTLAKLIDRCCWDKLALNKRPKYVDELRRAAMAFAREGHAEKDADQIAQRDVERWLTSKGWSPKSQIVYLINLTTVFSWGIEKGHVTINPCVKITRPTIDQKPPEIFTVAQCQRLMQAALDTESAELRRGLKLQLLGYVAVCLFAGVRPEEAQRLDWSDVNVEEKFIEITALKSKTRRRRIVTISDNLAAWLGRVGVQEGAVTPVGLPKRLRTLRGMAEIEHWPSDVLRHSFASYHLAKHQSAEKTALEMGHSGTQMLFAHYRELVRPKEATAFWELRPAPRKASI